ncbi:hypothetical protein IFM89_026798 [Coptis chinensis]|uniref:Uncharacterized protein n=1 Tax=Coptis chinensis TaxID=261450 RepID=A0A835J285_9MAGN|nr:hypothetical protein IFM89_026798 [Coptis chinensis]
MTEHQDIVCLSISNKVLYQEALCIWLVYDITSKSSFNNIKNWIQDIESCARDNVYKMLVGNKTSNFFSRRDVPSSKGQTLVDEHGMKFYHTGGSSNYEVQNVLFTVMSDIDQRLLGAEKENNFHPLQISFYMMSTPEGFL